VGGIGKIMESVRPPVGVSPKLGQDGGGALNASTLSYPRPTYKTYHGCLS